MWTQSKSLILSRICVIVFAIAGIVILFLLPWLASWVINFSKANLNEKYVLLLISGYTLAVPAFVTLWELNSLLRNINKKDIFVQKNVDIMRRISWYCILVTLICFLSALYYTAFAVIGAMALFMGLIIRVLKNVFKEAVELKEENDYTI